MINGYDVVIVVSGFGTTHARVPDIVKEALLVDGKSPNISVHDHRTVGGSPRVLSGWDGKLRVLITEHRVVRPYSLDSLDISHTLCVRPPVMWASPEYTGLINIAVIAGANKFKTYIQCAVKKAIIENELATEDNIRIASYEDGAAVVFAERLFSEYGFPDKDRFLGQKVMIVIRDFPFSELVENSLAKLVE